MATKSRRKSTSVNDKLFSESHRFGFFQATRLLQGLVSKWRRKKTRGVIGHDVSPTEESVKFSAFPSIKFASTEIVKIKSKSSTNDEDDGFLLEDKPQGEGKQSALSELANKYDATSSQVEMQVSFMGLTGQSSALPVHLTELEITRIRDKDFALKEFYDLFNHRAISFFYRAWEKYRLPISYERSKLGGPKKCDQITANLHSIIGISGDSLKNQLQIDPEDLLYYAGFFAAPSRSASALSSALTEILDVPVIVNQFKGEWMSLLEEDRMRLPLFPLKGQNNCLGVDTVIGNEVFTVEGKFQLEIGPLNRAQFNSLYPGSPGQEALKRFTRLFVGDSFQFELKYVLQNDAITGWELNSAKDVMPRLGLNTWLLPDNIDDAVREIIIDVSH
ncbi:MAG: type VI secretion system baseplate subunit TssG [Gammaproteobacteria bacterium]|nr:type VI secretion system baseplate subunit TssG [Gammaproteobacteria bacterium]